MPFSHSAPAKQPAPTSPSYPNHSKAHNRPLLSILSYLCQSPHHNRPFTLRTSQHSIPHPGSQRFAWYSHCEFSHCDSRPATRMHLLDKTAHASITPTVLRLEMLSSLPPKLSPPLLPQSHFGILRMENKLPKTPFSDTVMTCAKPCLRIVSRSVIQYLVHILRENKAHLSKMSCISIASNG